ncbi:GNAT family N-acetyltransferase [Brachybacterium sp. Z12]|uniref:GNAT family N-acetyltransferase n=1 Tax=Brachybacterium sp. Z12 TaxID=2759167 RepID=UPI00223A70E8|nr:GNAT family N-acetyltransferase [Brachybacterium sp. Z12]
MVTRTPAGRRRRTGHEGARSALDRGLPERSGQGIGSAIVRFALDDIRGKGMKIRPTCWFVKGWVERHPEYADLLETPSPHTHEEAP